MEDTESVNVKPKASISARVWRDAEQRWVDLGVICDNATVEKESVMTKIKRFFRRN